MLATPINSVKIRFSIITACFNSSGVICEALESLQTQTHPDVEFIVVDGGSQDGTVKLIRDWTPKFGGRMRWISEPDTGLYDAINKGIRMATGDVVGILNSDDFYTSPDALAHVAARFAATQADAVYADVRFVDAGNLDKTVRYVSGRRFHPWMMRYGFMPPHPTIFCRRELFDQLGYYRTDYRISADHELMVRFLWKARIQTAYLPEAIITMRTGGISTRSAQNRLIACRENVRACRENGIYANLLMQLLKYPIKMFEYAPWRSEV